MRSHRLDALIVVACTSVLFCGTAHAFDEPEAGGLTLALQVVLGAILASIVAARAAWRNVRSRLGRASSPHGADEGPVDARKP